MKKLILLLTIVFCLSACNKNDEPNPTTPGNYTGVSTVINSTQPTSSAFINPKAVYDITINNDNTLDIVLVESQFAEKMPKLDMQFKNIPYTKNANGEYIIESPSFVPQISDVPYPNYTITDFKGKISGNTITVEYTCMKIFNVTYVGTLIEK